MTFPLPSDQAVRRGIRADAAQAEALARLDRLIGEAWQPEPSRWTLGRRKAEQAGRRGVYLWGPPGRGKTLVMDCAYAAAPEPKARVHFFAFFRELYRDLHTRFRGSAEPARLAVHERFAGRKVVCFDEFHVHDIADAMLLQAFLAEIVALPARLVFTSNYPPGGLLDDSRFRQRFAQGLSLLETRFEVIGVDGGFDYRTTRGQGEGELFVHPLGEAAERRLLALFLEAEPGMRLPLPPEPPLDLGGRPLAVTACGRRAVWTSFEALCAEARSSGDYLDLALRFDTVILSGATAHAMAHPWTAQRFVWLVDILYDAGITLALSSERPIAELVANAGAAADLGRLASRLAEMALWRGSAAGHALRA